MKQSEKSFKRIVVKIGSSLFHAPHEKDREAFFADTVGQIVSLSAQGKEIVLVSSGAIALGMQKLGLETRPKDLPLLQAAAAVGQGILMEHYRNAFRQSNINCAQVLLTWDDFSDRRRYLNAKNTLCTLLARHSIPIVNENDTVSTDEIKFGDNDRLSALVANLVSADLLVMLSDVEGLLDRDRTLVRLVDKITPAIKALACPTSKKSCVGGMVTKIEAARIAVESGIPCVIAHGSTPGIISAVVAEPGRHGTLFVPSKQLRERERWLAFGTRPKARITIDEGAKKAILAGKSLLSVGVSGFEGVFETGDIVSVIGFEGIEVARGKAGISSRELQQVKGSRSAKEVIHRDNIAVISAHQEGNG